MIKDFDIKKLEDICIEGVDTADYPDFCDAFIASADYDGRELTEAECDWVTDQCPELVGERAFDSLI